MQRYKLLRNILAVVAAVATTFAVILFLTVFQRKMMDLLFEMSLQNITEMQELYAETLRNKINDQFKTLEAEAEYFSDVDLSNSEQVKQRARSAIAAGDFLKIAVVNEEGAAVDYNGKSLPNMRNKDYFFNALAKNSRQISNKIELDERLNPCLAIAVPFKTKTGQKGVLAGFFSYAIMLKIFSIPVFSGQSYFYIVSGDGNILLFNKNKGNALYNIDVYDYIEKSSGMKNISLRQMKVDMIKEQPGSVTLDGVEGKKLFSYAPMKIKDWNLIFVLPYSYIKNQQLRISILVYAFLAAVAFAVLVFAFVIYAIVKKSQAIKKDNERLTIASNQAQTLIYEYNMADGRVDFSGDTQFLLGTDKKSFPVDFIRAQYYPRIHPDDKGVYERIRKSMQEGKENTSVEFRYRDFSDNYFWVRMIGSSIFGEDLKPKQFIGSITNVNSQVLHEQELRDIADRDKLSSLLNKAAFERNARDYLARDGRDRKSALIIVDLDNFKEVNDKLGHMTGDLAIKDAAKKISLIFSERDFLGRFGGDEFCVLMRFDSGLEKETVLKVIKSKAADLTRFLKEDYTSEGQSVGVTASVGIAVAPFSGSSYDDLFAKADQALYDVKQRGKDGYKISEEAQS